MNFWNDEQGQNLIEYILLMVFVVIASAALFVGIGGMDSLEIGLSYLQQNLLHTALWVISITVLGIFLVRRRKRRTH